MSKHLGRAIVIFISALLVSVCGDKGSLTSPTPASCTVSVSTTSLSLGAAAGRAEVSITAGSSCAWTATSDRNWITIVSGASGTGNGAVTIDAAANPDAGERTGMLTIGGQAIGVHQAGVVSCSIAITPASASFSKDAAIGSFDVTAAGACAWSVTSSAPWLTFTSPTQGSGNAHISYSIERNRDVTERRAVISIADRSFSVTQAGDSGACEYSVTPVQLSACMASPGALSTTITTAATCAWTVGTDASWITLTSGASGTGSSVVTFTLAPNWDAPRNGKVMLRWATPTAGQNVVVSQAGCRYGVSVPSIAIAAGGGASQFDVVQQSDPMECGGPLQNGCQWTATSDVSWITVTTPMPQTGDNPVHFTVAPNGTGVPRTGTITVRDKIVTVTQGA